MKRKNYMEYGGYLDGKPFYKDSYDAVSDKYPIEG